jgi:hypothetical protein
MSIEPTPSMYVLTRSSTASPPSRHSFHMRTTLLSSPFGASLTQSLLVPSKNTPARSLRCGSSHGHVAPGLVPGNACASPRAPAATAFDIA